MNPPTFQKQIRYESANGSHGASTGRKGVLWRKASKETSLRQHELILTLVLLQVHQTNVIRILLFFQFYVQQVRFISVDQSIKARLPEYKIPEQHDNFKILKFSIQIQNQL